MRAVRVPAFLLLSLFVIFPPVVHADILVSDSISTPGRSVMLKAVIKGRFFPEGGRLVYFSVDGRHIGRTLSGGDGYALLEYKPETPGLKIISVKSGDDVSEGYLLVMRKGVGVVVIEVEEGVMETPLYLRPADEAEEAIEMIMKRYRVIYITSSLGPDIARRILREGDIPPSIVVRWDGELFRELSGLGVRVKAVIGSPGLLREAKGLARKRYSFRDTEDGEVVRDWNDLAGRLLRGKGPGK